MPQDRSFEEFMKKRREVASAYVNGDAGPLRDIIANTSPSTFFGPGGGHVSGADAVWQTHERGADAFLPGSETQLEVLQQGVSGDVGYWVGIQRARVRMRGKPEPVAMALRVSELFRLVNGSWRLVHRHADLLAEASSGGKPAPSGNAPPADGGDGGATIRANEAAASNEGPPFEQREPARPSRR